VVYVSSLANVPLGGWTTTALATTSSELSPDETRGFIEALVGRSDVAAVRVGAATRQALGATSGTPVDAATALHHLFTRHRFLKGSRSLYPRTQAIPAIRRLTKAGAPVRVYVRGFPFKQYDNGLKAAGPLPDLAEAAALVRLRELQRAFTELYPPGLRITVLADGGYYRPRQAADLARYHDELARLVTLTGTAGFLEIRAQDDVLATAMGHEAWHRRNEWVKRTADRIATSIQPGHARHDAALATNQLHRLGLATPGVPRFDAIFRSLLYSVPVPGDGGPEWASRVLSAAWDLRAPPPLRMARLAVRERAWQDAIRYIATATVDERLGALDSLPPHVRLVTAAPRTGAFGFTYLGGSTLLPWHGTGFLDARGRVGVDFLVALRSRAYVPVHSHLLARGQPWCMIPARDDHGPTTPQLLAAIRLKAR
jgi:hypothetical protein